MQKKRWTVQEEEKLIELWKTTRLTCEQIGEELGRSLDAVEYRIRNLRKAGLLDYRNPNKIKNKYKKDLINVKKLTPSGAYFITSVLGDGHLRERGTEFGFKKRDCFEFRDIMCHILNITPPLYIRWQRIFLKGKLFDFGKFTIYSVDLAMLLAFTYGVPMGAKSGLVRLPRQLMKSTDPQIHGAILRAAYECEGGVNLDKNSLNVVIGNTSILFLQDLSEILERYIIENKIYGYRLHISSLESVMKFYELAYSIFDFKLHVTAKKKGLEALIKRKVKKRSHNN